MPTSVSSKNKKDHPGNIRRETGFKTKYPGLVEYAKKKHKDVETIISIYTLQVMWTSAKLAQSFGYTQQETQDLKMSKIIPWDNASVSRSLMEFFLHKGIQGAPTLTKDGKIVYIGGHAFAFVFEGEPYLGGYKMFCKEAPEKP